jgi:hydrogenase expression/formation protein HypE
MNTRITLSHGSGGRLSRELVQNLFLHYFDNPVLKLQSDSAVLRSDFSHFSFTTDSYVIDPVFFPGGDIGKLAVCGTVNDLAVSGAVPLYLSAGFIIEEGFPIADLERIVRSMANEAKLAGVEIVAGDTKIVNKGKADKVFINTAGVGELQEKHQAISSGENIKPGDQIILSGDIGRHEIAVMTAREDLGLKSPVESDCACLNQLIKNICETSDGIKYMRDVTRGGLATILNETVEKGGYGIRLNESSIPVREEVRSICELLGLDPLLMANEGRFIIISEPDEATKIVNTMNKDALGSNAAVIGEITTMNKGKVIMETEIGGSRIIDMLTGQQLPRIC